MYSIFCDESRHLENDEHSHMLIGAILCETGNENHYNNIIKGLKEKHGMNKNTELKWTKVSSRYLGLYKDIIDFTYDNPIFIRILIADKSNLDHNRFEQTHDKWYYKMYYHLLTYFGSRYDSLYKVYLDIKDTNTHKRVDKLNKILNYQYASEYIVKSVRSHEKQFIQVIDLIIGAAGYKYSDKKSSEAKLEVMNYLESKFGVNFFKKTAYQSQKINIFTWNGKK
ncbi:MAG: DUF3800 domain-containing protein [Candidatus Izemoplasma sp.]|nr:DUF3800 domain-containing protein [Candidatus Izemoplasma sp.]